MATTLTHQNGQIRELTRAEGWELLDARARHYLGLSAEEFLERYEAGAYRGVDTPEILRVVMAIPFAR